ncbi:apoptosis-inducing factor [Canna indica]|uniref:Apoptosis-inducing factor n=1 Tax=Canna indica TaxID=4628 RepID=A0AAQ3L2F3_9LILI|nr:apoptosis-inducing factor [Canna indica]
MEGEQSHRRVVVVGGGLAGALLAKHLQFDADVLLIDSKEYFEVPWARCRPMVDASFAERSLIQHTDYLSNARVISSPAIEVSQSEVLTAEGRAFGYDYLVIATGHEDSRPRSRKERLHQFEQENEKIRTSSSVLIIGGGRTGVQLAGEIAVDYPEKKVTLVHEGSRLLQFLGPKASEKALKRLRSKLVEVLLDQSVNLNSTTNGDGVFTTSAGRSVSADCHFVCGGRPLSSSWLKQTMLEDKLDRFGRLMVEGNLRVRGLKNVFAIGSIIDITDKQGCLAYKHAAVAAKNIKLLLKGGKEEKLALYKPSSSLAFVSLGRKVAVVQFSFTTVSGHIPGLFTSKDLFVKWNRKQMGLEAHIIS